MVKQLLKQRASWKKEKVDEETPRWDNWISGVAAMADLETQVSRLLFDGIQWESNGILTGFNGMIVHLMIDLMGYTQVSDGFCKKWFLIDFPIELERFFSRIHRPSHPSTILQTIHIAAAESKPVATMAAQGESPMEARLETIQPIPSGKRLHNYMERSIIFSG